MQKTQAPEIAQVWQALSHKVLATVLVDHGALFPLLDILGTSAHWFPPADAPIWSAIAQCARENLPPTLEAVAGRSNGNLGYLQSLANQWNDEDSAKVLYHAGELKRLGVLAELRSVGRDLAAAVEPDAAEEIIAYAVARLSGVMAQQTNRAGDAHSVGEAAWAILEATAGDGIPTGIKWFDELTGGIWPGFNYWVAGAYKSGKSTLMRNIVLNIATAGVACDVFCAEGSREMFALDCQAMLAPQRLCEQGERSLRLLRLSGLFLRRAWRRQLAVFTKAEIDAIQAAREQWNTLNIRIWDTADGIRNLATLRHRIQQSKFEFGSRVHFLDYSQLFGSRGTLFERQSATALAVQEISSGEDVAVWTLTQRNESAIGGGDAYSAGVKGGGDAAAAADFLLMPMIDQDAENMYRLKLKHSRHTSTADGTHVIDRHSGLLLDRWFDQRAARYQ